jgi:hypothetical protein
MNAGIRTRLIPVLLAVLAAATVSIIAPGTGNAQGPLLFSIQPAQDPGISAERRPYFTYELEPGRDTTDSVVISNNGQAAVTLSLYAADGITSINGSTSFAGPGEVRSDVRSWLSTDAASLAVPSQQSVRVPFAVRVPPDALPGDHVAGWVVEAPPKPGTAGGLAASVVERAGVAVVVRVPGPARHQLVLGGICLNQETGSNYFEVGVRNDGNVLSKAEGALVLTEKGGDAVFERAADLGNIVPNDGTLLRLDAPFDPGPGEYVATVGLTQTDGQQIEALSPIKIGDKKVNGCVPGAQQPDDAGGGLPYVGRLPGGGTPWLLVGLLIGALLAVILVREYSVRRQLRATRISQANGPVPDIEEDEVT